MKTLQQHINERLILNKDRVQQYKYFPKTKSELAEIINERDYLNVKKYNNDILNLNDIDTSNIFNFAYLFEGLKSTKININNWKFTNNNHIDIHGLFWNRFDIEEIYCDKIDVRNVEIFYGMFYHCKKLKTLNLNNWEFTNGYDFRYMFYGCINLDLSFTDDWDIPPEAETEEMFDNCKYIPKWYKI